MEQAEDKAKEVDSGQDGTGNCCRRRISRDTGCRCGNGLRLQEVQGHASGWVLGQEIHFEMDAWQDHGEEGRG